MRKPSLSQTNNVVSIDSARNTPEPPTPGGATGRATKKNYVLNQHSRRQFLALVFGPLAYGFKEALTEANHDRRDGWEQIVNMGRREWERKARGVAA